ncbi:hypothetical protein [Halomonas salipaludis]|uniref:Secreted protein n=1 Tax=Halomonas salipaludis TaxID=2032625 RepID=A0A2A2EVX2_9GAMM|nr:hypothetical protein [Halomonas salipaludis]PAU77276.1 hypothetical protein CK498_08515 [Halomonas salipaludis]
MLRLLLSWLLFLPLVLALALPSAAAEASHHGDVSCPIQPEPSVELLSSLDVDIAMDAGQDDSSSGCVTSCVNLSGGDSPDTGLLPPSSEALRAPVVAWLSTSPGRLERPPRV